MFILKFETLNDAFNLDPREEMARILRAQADKLEKGDCEGVCRDINGNSVGKWEWK